LLLNLASFLKIVAVAHTFLHGTSNVCMYMYIGINFVKKRIGLHFTRFYFARSSGHPDRDVGPHKVYGVTKRQQKVLHGKRQRRHFQVLPFVRRFINCWMEVVKRQRSPVIASHHNKSWDQCYEF
jgi:hypothetical protein